MNKLNQLLIKFIINIIMDSFEIVYIDVIFISVQIFPVY